MESAVWDKFRENIIRFGDVQRVENLCVPGTPDVNCCLRGVENWVELKWLACWPANCPTVKMPKIRTEQRVWWRRRGSAGGRVWVLLGLDRPKLYLLYSWSVALRLGSLTPVEMVDLACVRGGPRFPTDPMLEQLVHGRCA